MSVTAARNGRFEKNIFAERTRICGAERKGSAGRSISRICLIVAAFLGPSLRAQTQTPSEAQLQRQQEELKLKIQKYLRTLKPGETVLRLQAPQQPCAIPLKNAIIGPNRVPKMPRAPIPEQKFPMKEVQVPAPSCDDVK
jgi:hypothetical protein